MDICSILWLLSKYLLDILLALGNVWPSELYLLKVQVKKSLSASPWQPVPEYITGSASQMHQRGDFDSEGSQERRPTEVFLERVVVASAVGPAGALW